MTPQVAKTAEETKRIVMDKTLQNLLTLAREGSIERRSAALLVVGALKLDDDSVLEAVRIALENGNIILKDYALRYSKRSDQKRASLGCCRCCKTMRKRLPNALCVCCRAWANRWYAHSCSRRRPRTAPGICVLRRC